ncbi:MAG: PrsW family intramembrane metalloprotease [Anaerolineales bacterium]|nr:PrsW family intramembrane metalloprotease [Anaerolineales bacterium]
MNLLLLLVMSIFAGILPMVCWAMLVWWFDRYEKEPAHLLLLSFLWGVAPAAILSIVAELILALVSGYAGTDAPAGLTLFNLGLVAPLVEEGVKLLGLLGIFGLAQREVDGPLDGIIYGAMVGFGFAATENLIIFLSSQTMEELVLFFFLRAMVFGSMHAVFTSFSGLGLAFAKYARSPGRAVAWAAGGYLTAALFHGLHNFAITLSARIPSLLIALPASLLVYGIGAVAIALLSFGSLIRERGTIRKYLRPYVDSGIIRPHQWEAAVSMRTRLLSEWEAICRFDFRRYRLIARLHTVCAELAFKEKQRQLWGKDEKIEGQISDLASELTSLSKNAPHPAAPELS